MYVYYGYFQLFGFIKYICQVKPALFDGSEGIDASFHIDMKMEDEAPFYLLNLKSSPQEAVHSSYTPAQKHKRRENGCFEITEADEKFLFDVLQEFGDAT